MSLYDDYNFQDRMAEGKLNAMTRRNRGLPSGKSAKGWTRARSQSRKMSLCDLEDYYYQFKQDIHKNAYLAVEFALFGHEWEGF